MTGDSRYQGLIFSHLKHLYFRLNAGCFDFLEELITVLGVGCVCLLLRTFFSGYYISIICQKQMEVEVCSPAYFWISSSQSAIISHQVGFTSPWTTSSLCAKLCHPVNQESSSCAYCYQPKPPAICVLPNCSNWSPHYDSHVTGSVSTCQHKNCNWAAVLEWMQPALEEEKNPWDTWEQ